jgi:PST family polysaccharide transporter
MNKYFSLGFWKNFLGGTPTRKRLVENFFSLSFLQALNYLLPLITLPYLVRILGPEKFGLISFAQAFIGYFVILANYGFNLSATREISINRESKEKVSEIFSSVMVVKFFLGIVSFSILVLILAFIPRFGNDWIIYMFTFGMVLGNILFPVWFFQGMERMKYITILNIVSRGIFTICIFIFIRKMSDYIYVPLINSSGYLIAGALSLGVAFKNFGLKFTVPTIKSIKHQLREGWHIFISTISISLYTTSNIFILGLFTNNTIVGYYSAAEKIVRAVQGLLMPVSQTVYPYISKLATKSKQKALSFIRKLVVLVGIGSFIISLLFFILAGYIVNIFLGSQYQQSIIVLRILAFLPFIIGLSNIFGIQTMLTFNLKKAFSKILIAAGLLNIFLALILVPFYF